MKTAISFFVGLALGLFISNGLWEYVSSVRKKAHDKQIHSLITEIGYIQFNQGMLQEHIKELEDNLEILNTQFEGVLFQRLMPELLDPTR